MEESEKNKKTRWKAQRFGLWIWFLHLLAVVILGLSFFPMIFFFYSVWKGLSASPAWFKVFLFSFSIGFGYFIFGTALLILCAFTRKIFRFNFKAGLYEIHSLDCLRWMGYNSLVLLANAAFLDVLRLSPFQTFFYRMMGAKIGKGVNINTSGLADLCLLEIGDNVLVGGGAALICHASERGFIRLAPTKLGNRVSIGLGSVIMPDCEIGEAASIAPCSLLPKGTRVPPRGHWGGNPAQDLRAAKGT
jgi:non-ribosomal peptide synthetase-like protein